MKLALITNLPECLQTPRGGVQSTAVATVQALSENSELDLHVIVVNREVHEHAERRLGHATLHYRRAKQRPVLMGAVTDQRRTVTRLLDELRPDVVHACDTSYFKVGYRRCPVIYHVQGSIHADTQHDGRAAGLRSRLWAMLEQRGLRRADAVLVNNPCVAESLVGQRANGVFVADEPVHADVWNVARRDAGRTILCVGGVTALKNSVALVESLALLRNRNVDACVRFAGAVDPRYEPQLRQRLAELNVENRCTLLGHLSRAQLLDELAGATVLAHPSLREHAPAAIAEALVAGVPVVASHVGGIPYMVEEGVTGFLIEPRDSGQLADRLERLLCDDALRTTMSTQARAAARQRWSGPAIAQRLTSIYDAVLTRKANN